MKRKHSTEQVLAALRQLPPEVTYRQVAAWVREARTHPIVYQQPKSPKWLTLINWNQKN